MYEATLNSVKYAWVDAQRHHFGLDEMCAVLDVSESGYQSWKHGGKPERKRLADAQMLALIQAIHVEFKDAYGSPRMARELRLRGFPASKERVERHQGKAQAALQGHDGLEAQPADRAEPAGSELYT